MPVGLIGRKCGMTQLFTEAGEVIPVTVIEVLANRIAQVKTVEKEGYRSIQVVAGMKKASHVSKPMAGHFAKANVEGGNIIREFRLHEKEMPEVKEGDQISVETFEVGQKIDVQGISKGKGFAGAVKRHHFSMQDATHGNSLSHRAPGSSGQNQSPGRVFKGKRMAGHLGNVKRTVQNQKIIKIDAERHLLLVRGAVPGAPGGNVIITPAIKTKKSKAEEK